MAREFGRIFCRIWSDRDFKALPASAQRLYMLLVSQRWMNHAGVVPLTLTKWANSAADTAEADVWRDLDMLQSREYIVVDACTEEVLVRSLIRSDGVWKQPNVLTSALRAAVEVESSTIRLVLATELRKLGLERADQVADQLERDLVEPLPNPSGTLPEGLEEGSGGVREVRGVGERGKEEREGGGVRGGGGEKTRQRKRARGDPDFEAFYAAYPRKVGRVAAEAAWRKAVSAGADPVLITAGAARFAAERDGEDPRYTPHPATWLNGARWMDEAEPPGAAPTEKQKTIKKLLTMKHRAEQQHIPELPAGD